MNTYENAVMISRTGDTFTGISNMSGGFPLLINNFRIPTCENLFQALKFPNHPELQSQVLSQTSPMGARTLAGKVVHKSLIREDWSDIQLEVMDYCIRAKLIWNWVSFGHLLRESVGQTILENSSKNDLFWGVRSTSEGYRGINHLGQLLMGLRDEYLSEDNEVLHLLTPPDLGLKLGGEELQTVDRRKHLVRFGTRKTAEIYQLRPDRMSHTSMPNQNWGELEKAVVNY